MDTPTAPQPNLPNPNTQPIAPVQGETLRPTPTPEVAPPAGGAVTELAPQNSNPQNAGAPLPPPQIWPTDTPLPAPPVAAPAQAQVAGVTASVAPATADDVDVIEKEWVEAAEKVVEATKNDPYTEEEAVESLQVDYLKKRYGKEVKKTDV